jgi:hypothetical protein
MAGLHSSRPDIGDEPLYHSDFLICEVDPDLGCDCPVRRNTAKCEVRSALKTPIKVAFRRNKTLTNEAYFTLVTNVH